MGQFDLFRKIAQSSLTSKERDVNLMKSDLSSDFEDTPSFNTVLINGVSRGVHIVNDSNIIKNPNKKRLLCKPNETINIGDVVVFNNSTWICTEDDTTSPVNGIGLISRCNNVLNINKNNVLTQVHCIVETVINLYKLGTEDTKYTSEPLSNIIVKVPYNSVTSLIKRDDIYKLRTQSYRVIDWNDDIQSGLIVLKMEYEAEQQVLPIYSLSILNGSSIQVNQNDSLTINSQVTDTTTNTIITPTPSITYSSSNPLIATINASTGVVTILSVGSVVFTAKLTSNLTVLDTISVEIVSVPVSNYVVELSGDNDIVLGYESTLTARILDNGIWNEAKGVTWTVTNQDLSINQYINIMSQNSSSITLKASSNTAYKNKIVVVKATFTEDALVYSEKEVKLITLF